MKKSDRLQRIKELVQSHQAVRLVPSVSLVYKELFDSLVAILEEPTPEGEKGGSSFRPPKIHNWKGDYCADCHYSVTSQEAEMECRPWRKAPTPKECECYCKDCPECGYSRCCMHLGADYCAKNKHCPRNSKEPTEEKAKLITKIEYASGEGFAVQVLDKAPEEAIPADRIALHIHKNGESESRYFTPDEAMSVGIGLIQAVDCLAHDWYREFRTEPSGCACGLSAKVYRPFSERVPQEKIDLCPRHGGAKKEETPVQGKPTKKPEYRFRNKFMGDQSMEVVPECPYCPQYCKYQDSECTCLCYPDCENCNQNCPRHGRKK